MIAKDFAAYLALYNKYKTDYAVEDLLQGKWDTITLGRIRNASLDEHLSIVGLLNGKLSQLFTECFMMDAYVTKLYQYMLYYRDHMPGVALKNIWEKSQADFQAEKKAELITKKEEKIFLRVTEFLEKACMTNDGSDLTEQEVYDRTKEMFEKETETLEEMTEHTSLILQNVFDFMEAAFGDGQEMVAFITELNANYYSIWFIKENGSDQYFRHNKGLLFDDRQKLILGQMEELENDMNRGIREK